MLFVVEFFVLRVKPDNAKEIFAKEDVDGGLIGGASLNAVDFVKIVNSF